MVYLINEWRNIICSFCAPNQRYTYPRSGSNPKLNYIHFLLSQANDSFCESLFEEFSMNFVVCPNLFSLNAIMCLNFCSKLQLFFQDQLGYLFLFYSSNLIIVCVLCSLINVFPRNRVVIVFISNGISGSRRRIFFSDLINLCPCLFLVVFKTSSIMPCFSSLKNDS